MESALRLRWESWSKQVEDALDGFLPSQAVLPLSLHKAMRYSVFAGGKRLRPVLCLAAAEAAGGEVGCAIPAACAVECVHTYSLIHDDLPCMDDDDLRRGKPTCHKVFGEAVAVLAGDALLTLAFEILAESGEGTAVAQVRELAKAAGSQYLVGGQVADMEAEGKEADLGLVEFIHGGKTAAMIAASLRMGALAAGAGQDFVRCVGDFGTKLGLAFQIQDDLLDITQSSEVLGKSAGKDETAQKATYPRAVGVERARAEARRLTTGAIEALRPLEERGEILRSIANYLLEREF